MPHETDAGFPDIVRVRVEDIEKVLDIYILRCDPLCPPPQVGLGRTNID